MQAAENGATISAAATSRSLRGVAASAASNPSASANQAPRLKVK